MRGRPSIASAAWPSLALVLVALAAWRAACVLAGPDIDTDAYAHHMIARAILADPHDLGVHWVWLPLFHYLQVPLVALGGTMNDVRWINVVLAALVPLMLFAYVRRTTREGGPLSPEATAWLAALFAAACPIAMRMGTTAQPEPLFAVLALAVAMAYERRRYATTALLLGLAVMVRYEAWAILAVAGAVTVFEELRHAARLRRGLAESALPRRGLTESALPRRRWLVVLVPGALILGWAVLRRPFDGRWFGFVSDTHEFASQAVADKGRSRGALGLAYDALYYPVFVAVRVLGPVALVAPFGVARTWRQQGPRFVLALGACLAFVSLSWVRRSSLGLDRHFVVVVALYATFAAQGVAAMAERFAVWARSRPRSRPLTAPPIAAIVSVGSLGGLFVMLVVLMGSWKGAIERGWPDRTALAAYLRTLPGDAPIFCDDATLEILSGLDRRRFDRHWVDDPPTWEVVDETARSRGVVYVATWRRKLKGYEAAGELVFRAPSAPDDPDAGVAVMRVAGSGRTAR